MNKKFRLKWKFEMKRLNLECVNEQKMSAEMKIWNETVELRVHEWTKNVGWNEYLKKNRLKVECVNEQKVRLKWKFEMKVR